MIIRPFQSLLIALAVAAAPAFGAFVDIGEAGNAADTHPDSDRSGMGSVNYTYSINDTEVSVSEFSASPVTGATTPWTNPTDPIAGITRVMAAQYCNWLTSGDVTMGAYTISGGAITGVTAHDGVDMDALVSVYNTVYVMPTEDEWYKAAYHAGGGVYTSYANGSEIAPNTSDANYNSASPWAVGGSVVEQNGTRDMMGNVWEWMEDAGTIRGGAYNEPTSSNLRAQNRLLGVPDSQYDSVGMRVVAIPEPGTISLMGLSTIGLFATRTVRRRKTLGKSLLPVRRARACDRLDERAEEVDLMEGERVDLTEFFKACFLEVKTSFLQSRESVSVRFWNHMVVKHERRVARRVAFRANAKKKAIERLDAFLAVIMK